MNVSAPGLTRVFHEGAPSMARVTLNNSRLAREGAGCGVRSSPEPFVKYAD